MKPVQTYHPDPSKDELASCWRVDPEIVRADRSNKYLHLPYLRIGGVIRDRLNDSLEYQLPNREGESP